MRVIRVTLLVMALACSAYAGEMQTGVTSAGKMDCPGVTASSSQATVLGEMPNDVTVAGDIPYDITLVNLLALLLL